MNRKILAGIFVIALAFVSFMTNANAGVFTQTEGVAASAIDAATTAEHHGRGYGGGHGGGWGCGW